MNKLVSVYEYNAWIGFPCVYCGNPVKDNVNTLILDNDGKILGASHDTCSKNHVSDDPYSSLGVACLFIGRSFAVDNVGKRKSDGGQNG